MTQTTTSPGELFTKVLDPANRPNPYPLYAQLRETPVAQLNDDWYAVSTHAEISTLLHDPRSSSDQRKSTVSGGEPEKMEQPSFLVLDPPEHDRLRRLVTNQFTPERVGRMHERIVEIVNTLLDAQRGQGQLDIVDDFAYPLPVTVICELLGVPREDEGRFHAWADTLAHSIDPDPGQVTAGERMHALQELSAYMTELIAARRAQPSDDMLSGLAIGGEPAECMDNAHLVRTMILLLVAGHETTVNLITNGMLTLLRHLAELELLRDNPERAPIVVEELLRYEPPVQFAKRFALANINIAGVRIPQGVGIYLLLAAGSRDPRWFRDPERFDPDRLDNQHLGFGGGIHYCMGAPLARIEAHVALTALAQRLVNPRLVADPPPYRPNAILRGPRRLPVAFERLAG